MNKSIELTFLKEAMDNGIDEDFTIGYLEKMGEIQREWMNLIDEIEEKTGDKEYRIKLASELLQLTSKNYLEKNADWKTSLEGIKPILNQVGTALGGGQGLGGGVVGGLGGGLGGLILAKLLGVSPMLGLLLGGLLGGTGGYSFGSGKNPFGSILPASASNPKPRSFEEANLPPMPNDGGISEINRQFEQTGKQPTEIIDNANLNQEVEGEKLVRQRAQAPIPPKPPILPPIPAEAVGRGSGVADNRVPNLKSDTIESMNAGRYLPNPSLEAVGRGSGVADNRVPFSDTEQEILNQLIQYRIQDELSSLHDPKMKTTPTWQNLTYHSGPAPTQGDINTTIPNNQPMFGQNTHEEILNKSRLNPNHLESNNLNNIIQKAKEQMNEQRRMLQFNISNMKANQKPVINIPGL